MASGSTLPPTGIAPATYPGMVAIVERNLHEFDSSPTPPATKHTWQTDDDGQQRIDHGRAHQPLGYGSYRSLKPGA
ncbi:hypothetical protein LCGC14_2336840 [marine sediment metagenome]|uniref:Uncharacterized protein n=1 Tax=marine sediment metagenome TaxID=412755 RepID=A0A0F9CD76_9ZZZZ